MNQAFSITSRSLPYASGSSIFEIGVNYVKAIKAPLSHIKLLAVGGVNETNIAEYLKAGVCGFGIGSNIVSEKSVAENDYKSITALAKKYVSAVIK